MKHLYAAVFFIFLSIIVNAQSAGDYRSLATGNWGSASSWQIYNGTTWVAAVTPPSSADGIITIRSPHIITVNAGTDADDLVVASGASLILNAPLSVEDGAGDDVVVNGSLTSNVGIIGFGTVVVNGNFNWFGYLSANTTIESTGILNLNTNSTIRQLTESLTNNGTMNLVMGGIEGGELINTGTMSKTTASVFSVNSTWTNTGTITILGGTLVNASEDATGDFLLNSGVLNIAAGTVFDNTGYYINDGGSMTGAGTFLQNGDVLLNTNLTIPNTISVTNNTGVIDGIGSLTVTNLVFNDGTIEGSGALSLLGTTTWAAGTITRNVTISASNIINLTGSGDRFIGGTFIVNGTMNISGGTLSSIGGTLANAGTINKISPATAIISMSWSNTGTINVLEGELESNAINGDTFTKSGTLNISSGATFTNSGHYIHAGGTLTGAGTFNQEGTDLQLNTGIVVAPTVTFILSDGIIYGAGAFTATNAQIINGTISNTGALSLLGTTTWSGGEILKNFTLAAGNTLNITSSAIDHVLGGTLTNNGTIILSADILDAGGTIINNGILTISGTSSLDVILQNRPTGIINGTGELALNNTFTNTGTISPGIAGIGTLTLNGAELFSASSILNIEIASTAGAGTGNDLIERDGDLVLNGTLNVAEIAVIPNNNAFTIINLTSGTITGTFSTVNIPAGYTLDIQPTAVVLVKGVVVPVQLLSFQAAKDPQNNVVLKWVTENEINNSHFIIERSEDGRSFTAIGTVTGVNLPGRNNYRFIDDSPLQGFNSYRLKQYDFDGSYSYSEIRVVEINGSIITVSPNPVVNTLNIAGAKNIREILIIDVKGRIIQKLRGSMTNEILSLNVSNLIPGQYFLRTIGDKEFKTIPFIKY